MYILKHNETELCSSVEPIKYVDNCWVGIDFVISDTTKDYTMTYIEEKEAVPTVITMRQARLALLGANLLTTVDDAIATGTDEALKIEWEYATECRRDWQSLIVMATALGVTELQLDEMFILGSTL